MSRVRVVLSVLLLASTALGAASANHATLYRTQVNGEPIDATHGMTREDDGEVVHYPSNTFDGRVNHIVGDGRTPGDGSLFLDARIGNYYGVPFFEGGVVFYWGSFAAGTLPPDILLPGEQRITAWYGTWLDKNGDGEINDVHDQNCGTACALDEFAWRGQATDEAVTIFHFALGTEQHTRYAGGSASMHSRTQLNDYTALTEAEQGWVSYALFGAEGGLLATSRSVTIAGARPVTGGAFPIDIDDPSALIDVDRYESMNADIAALYGSMMTDAANAQGAVIDPAVESARVAALGIVDTAGDGAEDAAAPATSLVTGAGDGVPSTTPGYAKEPTHALDDFEGRAVWGGTTSLYGYDNAYPGHSDGYHFYADAYARSNRCVGAYAEAPTTGVSTTVYALCPELQDDPASGALRGEHAAGTILWHLARAYLWFDANRDTHLGAVCDPNDPAQFDAERNTCRAELQPQWPHRPSQAENVGMCTYAKGRGETYTVEPVGASWPNVIVVRDFGETGRAVFTQGVEVYSGNEVITMRWNPLCTNAGIESRDALVFPGEMNVPVLMKAAFSLSGYRDLDKGIDIGLESVLDVDLIPALM